MKPATPTRSRRRHHRQLRERRAKKVLRLQGVCEEAAARWAPRFADNLRYCSCSGCSSHNGWPTRQEERAELSFREQLQEIGR